MLRASLHAHPDWRYILVGHSLGGDVAFQYLMNYANDPTVSYVDGVITLDSQLGGTPWNATIYGYTESIYPPCVDHQGIRQAAGSGQAINDLNDRYRSSLTTGAVRSGLKQAAVALTDHGGVVKTFGNHLDTLMWPSAPWNKPMYGESDVALRQTYDGKSDDVMSLTCPGPSYVKLSSEVLYCNHEVILFDQTAVQRIGAAIYQATQVRVPSKLVPVLSSEQETALILGTFGLQWLPDTHMSFLRTGNGVEVYITSRVESYRFVGTSFDDLHPSPSSGSKAVPVLSPTGSGFDSDYTGLGSVLTLPGHDPHFRLGFFHAEQCDRNNYTASVGLAISTNDGQAWSVAGQAITGQRLAPRCQQVTGAGQPAALIVGNYVYVYYTDWPSSPGVTDVPAEIYLARAPLNQATDPGAYQKYDSGQWTLGVGGASSPVISPPSDSPLYAANVGVSLNSALGEYLATVEVNDGFGYATSPDGITWSPVRLFARFESPQYPAQMGATWYSYPSLLDPTAASDQVTGSNDYLYYATGIQGIEPHYMVRRALTLEPTASTVVTLPRPVQQVVVVPYQQTAQVPPNFACPWDNPVNGVKYYDDDSTTALIQVTTQTVTVQNIYDPNGVTCIPFTPVNMDILRASMPTNLRKIDLIDVPGSELQNRVVAPIGQPTQVPAGYVCPGDNYINNAKVFDDNPATGLVEITTQPVTLLHTFPDSAVTCLEATDANVSAISHMTGVQRVDTIHVPGETQGGASLALPSAQGSTTVTSVPAPATKPPVLVPQGQPTTVPAGYACSGDAKVNGLQVYDNDSTTALIEVTTQVVTRTNIYGDMTCIDATDANIQALKASKQGQATRVDVIDVPGQAQPGAPSQG